MRYEPRQCGRPHLVQPGLHRQSVLWRTRYHSHHLVRPTSRKHRHHICSMICTLPLWHSPYIAMSWYWSLSPVPVGSLVSFPPIYSRDANSPVTRFLPQALLRNTMKNSLQELKTLQVSHKVDKGLRANWSKSSPIGTNGKCLWYVAR